MLWKSHCLLGLLVVAGKLERECGTVHPPISLPGALATSSPAVLTSSESLVVYSSFQSLTPLPTQFTQSSSQYSTVTAKPPHPSSSTHLTPSPPPTSTHSTQLSSSTGGGRNSSSVPFPSPEQESDSDRNFQLLLYTVPPLAFVVVVVTALFLVSGVAIDTMVHTSRDKDNLSTKDTCCGTMLIL